MSTLQIMTVKDVYEIVNNDQVCPELLIYVLGLWVFQQCEDMTGYRKKYIFDDRAVCNHGEDNWTGEICHILLKLGMMKSSHMSHTFVTAWRPWNPLTVTYDETIVPRDELIAAIYYMKYQYQIDDAKELRHKPFQTIGEIDQIPRFEIPKVLSAKFSGNYRLWIGRVASTVFVKLNLAHYNKDTGFQLNDTVDPINAFIYKGLIEWDQTKLTQPS
ncbi:hypothetical protein [Pseudovibrio sp. Tun.PSC04-5.I4]|uniref:hypothetical protein n=1 Tax=Pseudovibrio sp. Tun.PSC04-5.I4 TaxID=1798213 RepID=UPI00088E7D94|nr:hypothetical protein [Pseudovibrio sp. Tun.PSC04-5.I4]SDQ86906.1 hypothetical protein SAMN04515695_1711 [Pseudovibrio sp. Tun.PSC04-5.I4]